MSEGAPNTEVPLVASPYDLRVSLGESVDESHTKAALRSGDLGFVHSFTTGSAVDGPGIRLVAWTSACMFRCQYCHNPDTWTLSNGIPVTIEQATDELRKYQHGLKAMGVPTTLVVYEGEGHALRKPEHLRDLRSREIAWFNKYLK